MLTGKNLIAGEWRETSSTFHSNPFEGSSHEFSQGTVELVDQAARAAENAFWSYGSSSREARANFLETVANEIEARGESITELGTQETALPSARLEGERARTTGQLKLFASHIRDGAYLDYRHDPALPDRKPQPRPDFKMVQRPIGPVAVFGASNFPLAFSVAGGDTASALAAGCPVVVKGHPAHPGTSEIVAQAISAAVEKCNIHPGVFSLVQDGGIAVGQALVQHELITAVGFTGSLKGGRALFDLCAKRDIPIPFYGELGSINPMFLFPEALNTRGEDIAKGWAGSLTMGAGQFCTNPGVVFALEGASTERFIKTASEALSAQNEQTMLTDGIAEAYRSGKERVSKINSIQKLVNSQCSGRSATPALYRTTAQNWNQFNDLHEEIFGPLGIIVTATNWNEIRELALNLNGQLTCTVHCEPGDEAKLNDFMPIIERKAGRILANGFPTGVEVCDSMVHGGPYPATTNFGHTSVGTLSIRRWLRPVCYQDIPENILNS